jgi:hypothetical protein
MGHIDMADLFFGTGAVPMSPPESQDPSASPSNQSKLSENTDKVPDLDDPLEEYYEEAERLVALAVNDGVRILFSSIKIIGGDLACITVV